MPQAGGLREGQEGDDDDLERYSARHNLPEVLQATVVRALRERPPNAVAAVGRCACKVALAAS